MVDYGVQIQNAFYLLDDDAPAPAKPKAQPKEKKAETVKKPESKPQSSRGARGDRPEGRGRGGRGRGRGDRPNREKREFDRHESGTGRDRRAKKGGAGAYNWGTEGEQGDAREGAMDRPPRRNNRRNNRSEKPAAEKPAETTEGEEKPAVEGEEKPKKEEPVVEEEPEPETVGLTEYLASKGKVEDDENLQMRKVEDDSAKWKTSTVVAVEETDPDDFYGLGSAAKTKKGKKGGKKTNKVHLDEFASSTAGGNDRRGGRGRGRGRGGRGGRGNKDFNLRANADQFPTLAGK